MIQTITEYKVVFATTATQLSEKVNAEMKTGFQPFGNIVPTVVTSKDKFEQDIETDILMQAVVKYSYRNA